MKSKIENQKSKIVPLILASASPRRAELLTRARIPFEVIISPEKEPTKKPAAIPTELWPIFLAYAKALAVQKLIKNRKSKIENQIILAADTIVVDGSRILNKSPNRSHAKKILTSLNHKPHTVITGLCFLTPSRVSLTSATATTKLHFTPKQLETYLDSNLWKGKAGAYGIQDPLSTSQSKIENQKSKIPCTLLSGELSTVIGLPLHLVQSELASFQKD